MKVIIFTNGKEEDEDFVRKKIKLQDTIIAVDGGLNYVYKLGLKVDFILGDFDSIDKKIIDKSIYKKSKIVSYPKHKDFTDLELALDLISKEKFTEVIIFGGTGNRIDHYIGNINALNICLEKGIKASIQSKDVFIYLIKDILLLSSVKGKTISLIPLTTEVLGIKTLGLFYPLNDENLYVGSCRGISNIAKDDIVSISLLKGKLIVIVNN